MLSVPGMQPSLTARVRMHRGRRTTSLAISGWLLLPAPVARSACGGLVMIQVKHGAKTVSSRQEALMTDCTYQQRSSIPTSRLLGRSRNQIIVRFLGNYLLKPASARARE